MLVLVNYDSRRMRKKKVLMLIVNPHSPHPVVPYAFQRFKYNFPLSYRDSLVVTGCIRCYFPLFAAFLLFSLWLFPFSSSLSLSPVSFPLFLTFFSFLREDCVTYLTCSELHCDPSPSHLKPLSLSSILHVFLFSRTFFFHLLVIFVPFLKLFSAKSSF